MAPAVGALGLTASRSNSHGSHPGLVNLWEVVFAMRAVGTGWTPPGGTGPCFHWKPGLALARSSGGAYFGEVALIEHEPHNASVYAQGEASARDEEVKSCCGD